MFVPDAISRAFMGPHAHPTGVLAAVEAEAPFSGKNDLWVTHDPGRTVVLPDYTPADSGKAITYGVVDSPVGTVSAIMTRKQARRRTPHDMLPAMTIPEVSRVRHSLVRKVNPLRGPGVAPKVTRTEYACDGIRVFGRPGMGDDSNESTVEGSLPRTVIKSRGERAGRAIVARTFSFKTVLRSRWVVILYPATRRQSGCRIITRFG